MTLRLFVAVGVASLCWGAPRPVQADVIRLLSDRATFSSFVEYTDPVSGDVRRIEDAFDGPSSNARSVGSHLDNPALGIHDDAVVEYQRDCCGFSNGFAVDAWHFVDVPGAAHSERASAVVDWMFDVDGQATSATLSYDTYVPNPLTSLILYDMTEQTFIANWNSSVQAAQSNEFLLADHHRYWLSAVAEATSLGGDPASVRFFTDTAIIPAPVPEPVTLTLFGVGAAGILARGRRNRSRRSETTQETGTRPR
jgi:PEP-CTERM motif